MSSFKQNTVNKDYDEYSFGKFGSDEVSVFGTKVYNKPRKTDKNFKPKQYFTNFFSSTVPVPKPEYEKNGVKYTNDQTKLNFNINRSSKQELIGKYGDNTKNNDLNVKQFLEHENYLETNKEEIFKKNKTGKNNDITVANNYLVEGILSEIVDKDDKYLKTPCFKDFVKRYEGEVLDEKNLEKEKSALFNVKPGDTRSIAERKVDLELEIFHPQGSQQKLKIKYTEIISKSEPILKITYRNINVDNLENIKKPNEFSNEDLENPDIVKEFNSLYGEVEPFTITDIEALKKYLRGGYYRLYYSLELTCDSGISTPKNKKKFGFRVICRGLDIIVINDKKKENDSEKEKDNDELIDKVANKYKSMAFGNKVADNDKKTENSSNSVSNDDDDEYEIEEVEVSDSDSGEEEIVVKKPTIKKEEEVKKTTTLKKK